jgi:hypothetical protein
MQICNLPVHANKEVCPTESQLQLLELGQPSEERIHARAVGQQNVSCEVTQSHPYSPANRCNKKMSAVLFQLK